jgi:hypothetical protein
VADGDADALEIPILEIQELGSRINLLGFDLKDRLSP